MAGSEWAEKWYQQALRHIDGARHLRVNGYWSQCASACGLAAEVAVRSAWTDACKAGSPRDCGVDRLAADIGAPPSVLDAVREITDEDNMLTLPPGASVHVPREFSSEEADDWIRKAERVVAWVGTR